MGKRNWRYVAEKQFKSMPKDFQDDWGELRNIVNNRDH
ncbi:hypothetical protein BH23PAT1_BH23PAT1_2910 [soil metagenome]